MPGKTRIDPPAAARAYRMLERMVVMLELSPGAVTTEGALIASLRLGRTPVREAIQRLAWEGLLEIRPRAGIAIAPLNAGDWPKIIDARHSVEVLLARSAARFAYAGIALSLESAAERMRGAAASGDTTTFLEADKELDEILASAAENPFAARLVAPLRTHSRRFWFRYRAGAGLADAAGQHLRVIAAVVAGNEEQAGQETDALMRMQRSYAASVARP